MTTPLSQDADLLESILASQPIATFLEHHSFEQWCYICLENTLDLQSFMAFQAQGMHQREALIPYLSEKKELFSAPQAALQSISASMTVYEHPWAYYNQLLVAMSSFFDRDLKCYTQLEQQILLPLGLNDLNLEDLPFFSSLLTLIAFYYQNHAKELIQLAQKSRCDLSAFVSAYTALFSPRRHHALMALLSSVHYSDMIDLKRNLLHRPYAALIPQQQDWDQKDKEVASLSQYIVKEMCSRSQELQLAFEKTDFILEDLKAQGQFLDPLALIYSFLIAKGFDHKKITLLETFSALPRAMALFQRPNAF